MLLPFQGEYMQLNMNPGVPLRSAPGYVLVAPAGRVLPEQVLPRCVHPMFGRLCSLILLTNLYSNNGCLVLQNSRYCKLKVPLLQARTALSAFLTK